MSGGQTGVDRAALDAALHVGIPCGGWCPKGRRAEDGRIATRYPLRETPEADTQRTAWNVRDSDATLIRARGTPHGGTALTIDFAHEFGRPVRIVDLDREGDADATRGWLVEHRVTVLNIAGPRESGAAGVYAESRCWLEALFRRPLGSAFQARVGPLCSGHEGDHSAGD